MYPSRVKSLKSLMTFIWEDKSGDPSRVDKIIERNGWTNLHGEGGAICTDGKKVLLQVGCGACYDLILEDWIEEEPAKEEASKTVAEEKKSTIAKKDKHYDDGPEFLWEMPVNMAGGDVTNAMSKALNDSYGGKRCIFYDIEECSVYGYSFPCEVAWVKEFKVSFEEPEEDATPGRYSVEIISEEGNSYYYNLASLTIWLYDWFAKEFEKSEETEEAEE